MKLERNYVSNNINEKTTNILLEMIPQMKVEMSHNDFIFTIKNYSTLLNNQDIKIDVFDILNRIGVRYHIKDKDIFFTSDYDFRNILKKICSEKLIDDYKSYQYYATKERLAKKIITLADFKTNTEMTLEPSAGQGGIAKYIPSKNLHCVEFSKLNSEILKEKGFNVFTDDFINFSEKTKNRYDKVIMSPPFLGGKGIQHVINAYALLKENGILISILPVNMKNKIIVENAKHTYSEVMKGDFENTDIDFIILKMEK